MTATGRRIAGAAALIAVITVVARLVGFGRIVVFYGTVGENQLGQVYQAANTVPNVIFELVAGGALASLVVPLLAAPIAAADRAAVDRTVSALLTWSLLLLLPMAALVALFSGPLMSVLSGQADPSMVALGARMLRVFAPQLPLYGIGIVLVGVLQAHRRFAWPALAPLLSSLTVITSYLSFALVAGAHADIGEFGLGEELLLSVGTTLGVAVMSLCLVVPVWRLGIRYRPTLRFTAPQAATIRGLAFAGGVTVGMRQLALLLVVYLSYPPAPIGSMVVYTFAQSLYQLPWGVLAVPLATSAYPALAEAAVTGNESGYRRLLAGTTRVTLLLGLLGGAGLVAVAGPAAQVMARVAGGAANQAAISAGVAWFGPGLVGYALFALLSRALYARGDTVLAAWATLGGWLGVIVTDLLLVAVVPPAHRVAVLAAGNSAGMLLLGGLLLAAVARRAGAGALAGTSRAAAVGTLAAVIAGAAGYGVAQLAPAAPTLPVGVGYGLAAAVVTVLVFGIVSFAADRSDALRLAGMLSGRARGMWPKRGS